MEIIPTKKIVNRDGIKAVKNGQKANKFSLIPNQKKPIPQLPRDPDPEVPAATKTTKVVSPIAAAETKLGAAKNFVELAS